MSETLRMISDLILELEQIRYEHGDLPVLVDGYEDDYDEAKRPVVTRVHDKGAAEKAEEWWNGRYVDERYVLGRPVAPAVVIPR